MYTITLCKLINSNLNFEQTSTWALECLSVLQVPLSLFVTVTLTGKFVCNRNRHLKTHQSIFFTLYAPLCMSIVAGSSLSAVFGQTIGSRRTGGYRFSRNFFKSFAVTALYPLVIASNSMIWWQVLDLHVRRTPTRTMPPLRWRFVPQSRLFRIVLIQFSLRRLTMVFLSVPPPQIFKEICNTLRPQLLFIN